MSEFDERFYRPCKEQIDKVAPKINKIRLLQEKINKQSDEISNLEIMIIGLKKRVNELSEKIK